MLTDQLSWLPTHPDLSGAIKRARDDGSFERRAAVAVELAGYRRDFVMTNRIDRLITESPRANGGMPQVKGAQQAAVRIALLSSHTVDHLVPAIRVAGLWRRLAPEIHVSPYGLYRQVLLGRDPALADFSPQFIVLALDALDLRIDLPIDAPVPSSTPI